MALVDMAEFKKIKAKITNGPVRPNITRNVHFCSVFWPKSETRSSWANIQGAIDLEAFQFTFVEAEKINAHTTRQMLEKLEQNNRTRATIHVYLDNARYHHAKILQPWLNRPDRKVKLHFLPSYAPHLNPIERLWGVMHKWVTHNRHYATFNQFTEAILGFFRQTLPANWKDFRDTVSDNFRVASLKEYKVI